MIPRKHSNILCLFVGRFLNSKKTNDYLKNSFDSIIPIIIKIIPTIVSEKAGKLVFSCLTISNCNKKDIIKNIIPTKINPIPLFLVSFLSIIVLINKKFCSFILSHYKIKYNLTRFNIFGGFF